MIDKNEMRIGNYFIGEDKILWLSQIRHAENVKEWSYKGWHEETKQRIEVNFFEAEPIPLTTEILEKSGFENKKVNGFNEIDGSWWLMPGEYKVRFLFEYDKDKGKFFNGALGIQIKWVHKLQNLSFALTEKELEIKL